MDIVLIYFDRNKFHNEKTINVINDIDCFEQFYKLNNNLRYCNGSYFKFKDLDWENNYKNWLKSSDFKSKSFNLFYGKNGIVD